MKKIYLIKKSGNDGIAHNDFSNFVSAILED